jgi:N-carbamoylputrescine amidase
MSNALTVAVLQLNGEADKSKSLEKTEKWISDYAQKGAKLIVLQELHSTLYFCQTEDLSQFELAEPIPGPTSQRLSDIAKKYGIVLVGSIFEKRMPGVFHNTAVVFDSDGSMAGIYRKMHIPDDPGFYEKFYFTPGDHNAENNGFQPIQTSVGKLGVLVCWDQWYPEAARLMALAGAELLIYPTAIGWDKNDTPQEQARQLDAWITIQRSHAVANHLPVLVANRSGFEADPSGISSGIQFWGNSFISGPQGEILAQANHSDETGLICEIDKGRTDFLRQIWPYFRDRRVDAYDNLTRRSL